MDVYIVVRSKVTELNDAEASRLSAVCEASLDIFESDHGGHEDFVAALYDQACAALLSALFSGSATVTLASLAKRAGRLCVDVFDRFYSNKVGAKAEVRNRLNIEVKPNAPHRTIPFFLPSMQTF